MILKKNACNIVVVLLTSIGILTSCNSDFNDVGGEVIGGVNFQEDLHISVPVAYSKKFERVQTNNLFRSAQGNTTAFHSNPLGVYNDPVYGMSTYSILSQVQPQNQNAFPIRFGDNAVLESVVISIPYISRVTGREQVEVALQDADNEMVNVTETKTTYALDSIYQDKKYKLSIFQSNYFLRDFDPNTTERQIYYSNDVATNFGTEVESFLLYENQSFIPNNEEVIITEPDDDDDDTLPERTRLSPRLRIEITNDEITGEEALTARNRAVLERFKTLFIDKEGSLELENTGNFNNYFRGVYIKAEPIDNTGSLLYLDIRQADITLNYTFDSTTTVDNETTTSRREGERAFTFAGNVISAIKSEGNTAINEELREENQDKVNGEENLYLKGGDGSIAVIDLFNRDIINENGEEENELDFLKRRDWLINDANLKFYINQDQVTSGESEPERIYVFNLETGAVLADYNLDVSLQLANANSPINSISNHLGRINRGSDKSGEFYRIRITQHINNLLNGDIDNVQLGVAVSQNVNSITNVVGDTTSNTDEIIPTSSIISHEGTVLHGNAATVPDDKRLKLEIFYTESKNN